jgi:hypothetical protein
MKQLPINYVRTISSSLFCLILFVILATSQSPNQAIAQVSTINFGETISGSINTSGEIDTYTFSANTGDMILVGMSRVSGDLWQRIRLYDPDGNLLRDESSPVHVEISQLLPDRYYVFLPMVVSGTSTTVQNLDSQSQNLQANTPGTYTLLISDGFDGTNTGSYNLYIQRLREPAEATNISFSQTLSGVIDQPAEMDTFTLSANAGDTILIGMSRVSGDLWQEIRLYDSDGNLLNEVSSPVHTENVYTVPSTSDYTLLVADGFDGTNTGSYNIYLQRLNNPTNATPLSFGQTISGNIPQPADMDAFAFNANAGDTILLGMSRVSGDLWQEIRLYDPNGNLLNEESSPVHVENIYTVPNSGEYRVLLADGFDGTNTGSYNLYIQRLNNPSNATSISFGQTLPGSISQPAEMHTYTFSANANDTVLMGMTRTSGSLWQQIRIYDPDGNLLNEDSGPTQAEITQTLPTTGNYTILASDGFDGTFTGDYNINLQQLP